MNRNERKAAVLRAMLCMQRWPWEQGVASQALIAAGETELAVLMAHDAVVNQCKDGRLAMKSDRYASLDPAANGEAVLLAHRVTGDAMYARAAEQMLDYLLRRAPRDRHGRLFHNANEGELWIDAAFMAPPFLAMMGREGDAVQQLQGLRDALLDADTGLYSHRYDCDLHTFVRRAHWGVGNGWMLAGCARVIDLLTDADARASLAQSTSALLDNVLRYRRTDGLFHDTLDDPTSFVETNLAQMVGYTIYTGVRAGWLNERYLPIADDIREAVYTKVDAQGFVQDVCGSPSFDRAGTAVEGQAFYLLMEAAYDAVNLA